MDRSKNLIGLWLPELEEILDSWKEKKYKAKQIALWIYQRNICDFEKMTDLSKSLRQKLKENFTISYLPVASLQVSEKDGTRKFLFTLEDNQKIESVLMREKKRIILCLSTQVGCPLACVFCATGEMGYKRNLSSGEIVNQILTIKTFLKPGEKINNIVLMGMGEPLLNYENTLEALKIMTSELGLCLPARKITLSTAGVVDKIYQLAEENLKIKLAISLHSPADQLRTHLMPLNKKYPLKDLLAVAKHYAQKTRRRITFEYILIKGVNDSPRIALELAKAIQGIPCKINLILYNPIPGNPLERPDQESVDKFKEILYPRTPAVTLRISKGQDIQAACGQLKTDRIRKRKLSFVPLNLAHS